DTIWRATEPDGFGGMVQAEALRRGKPALTVECGGGNFTESHLRNYQTAIAGVCRAVGLMRGDAPTFDRYRMTSDGRFLHNREGGLFVPAGTLGEVIGKDEPIGRIINLYGDVIEEIRAPYDEAFVGAMRCPYYP